MGSSADRRKERRLAERVAEILGPFQTKKPIDAWLQLAGTVVGIGLWLWPTKTPVGVVIALSLIFLCFLHPRWNFWWIEDNSIRRGVALVTLCAGLVAVGFASWPAKPGPSAEETAAILAKLTDIESRLGSFPTPEAWPGLSFNFLLTLPGGHLNRRQYLWDEPSSALSRFSIYISANDVLTMLLIDGHGEPHSVEVPVGVIGGIPIRQPVWLVFNVGMRTDETLMSIDLDGREVKRLILPFQLTRNPPGKGGITLGASSEHSNGITATIYSVKVSRGTLDAKGLAENLKYFNKVAQELKK